MLMHAHCLRRGGFVAVALSAFLLLGGLHAAAETKLTSDSLTTVRVALLPTQSDEIRYGKLPPQGGGHGGSGATMVPIVDEDLLFMVQWTRDHLQADAAHQQATGAGVTVAVLDGGFNLSHPDLVGHISPYAYDAIDGDWDPEDLGNDYDDDGDGWVDGGVGHGTFVASMVLLAAPDATIQPIRIRDDEGWGFNFEMERGLMMAWKAGADVVNISGYSAFDPAGEIVGLINQMRRAGIAVIVSAGNDGMPGLGELAHSPDTLAVGSTDTDDVLAWFSNYDGSATPSMLMAPGVNLYGAYGTPEDDSSAYWSGTSFSCGLVSGAAALAVERNPGIAPLDLYGLLGDATDPAFDDDGVVLSGTGRINLLSVVSQ